MGSGDDASESEGFASWRAFRRSARAPPSDEFRDHHARTLFRAVRLDDAGERANHLLQVGVGRWIIESNGSKEGAGVVVSELVGRRAS